MPKRRGEVDPRERKAASKLARAPNVLSTSEAMLAAKFSIKKTKQSTDVTVPIADDRIKLIAEAKSHGQLFHATGGSHLTSDDFFKAMEVPVRAKKVKQLEEEKKNRLQLEKNEAEGKEVLAMNKETEQVNATQLEKLLLWHNVPKKEMGNKKEKLTKWKTILSSNQLPPLFQRWGPADEDKLQKLKESEITLNETALGRQKEIELKKMGAVMRHLNFQELDEIEEKMRAAREAKINETKAEKISLVDKYDEEQQNDDQGIASV